MSDLVVYGVQYTGYLCDAARIQRLQMNTLQLSHTHALLYKPLDDVNHYASTFFLVS